MGDDADDAASAIRFEDTDRKNTRRVFGPAAMGTTVVASREQAETVARRAEKMTTMAPAETCTERDLVAIARNMEGVKSKVHKRGTTEAAGQFDDVHDYYADEVASRAKKAEKRVSQYRFMPSEMSADEFNATICPKHLAGKATVGKDGAVTFADDATALDKLEIASNMSEYTRYTENPREWGRAEFERTSEFWDGEFASAQGAAYAYVDTDPNGDPRVLVESPAPGSRNLGTDVERRKYADEINRAIAAELEKEFPGHPANQAARVIVHHYPVADDTFDVVVPGDLQKLGVDPRDYYRELTNAVGKASGA